MLQPGSDYQWHDHCPENGNSGESDDDSEKVSDSCFEDNISIAQRGHGHNHPVDGRGDVHILGLALLSSSEP